MGTAHDMEKIELSIEEAKKLMDMTKAIERLEHNKDFKKVFTEGYFKDLAVKMVACKAAPSWQTQEQQMNVEHTMLAISHLQLYLRSQVMLGVNAEKSLQAHQAERELILEQEAAE